MSAPTTARPVADKLLAGTYLRMLFADAPGWITLSYKPTDGPFVGMAGAYTDPTEAAERVVELDRTGAAGVYVRMSTTAQRPQAGRRGEARDSLALPALWADLDVGMVGHKPRPGDLPLPPDEDAGRDLLAATGLPAPTVWVRSGGGLYPLWLFESPVLLDDGNRERVADLSTRWQQVIAGTFADNGFAYGAGVGDLARVLRVPGTVNRKAGIERATGTDRGSGQRFTLAELVEVADALHRPAPQRVTTTPAPRPTGTSSGDGPFDVLAETVGFDELLTGAGWTPCGQRHGRSIVGCWSRPGDPENPCSAHVLAVQPNVLVVHSEAAGLPTGGGRKLTAGRVFAHLHHRGDESAAGRDLRAAALGQPCTAAAAAVPRAALDRIADGVRAERDLSWLTGGRTDAPRTPAAVAPAAEYPAPVNGAQAGAQTPQRGDPGDDGGFWDARPVLRHLHDFARARRVAPWALLGATLARVVAAVDPSLVLPPIVGAPASLNLFVAIVGRSGQGKGTSEAAAAEAVNVGTLDEHPLGSGEGLLHAYVHRTKAGAVEQHTTAVLFSVAEVDTLTALTERRGATLLPVLRSLWMGERLGFGYADPTKRLTVGAHRYRAALVVGVQPERAGKLLDDADGGTPQRFIWVPAADPDAPEDPPPAPEPITWRLPVAPPLGPDGRRHLPVCQRARDEIDADRLARLKGTTGDLDGHALLARLKVAAALALLDSRAEVTDDDWTLAGRVMAKSTRTRTAVAEALAAVGAEHNRRRAEADAARAVTVAERVDQAATARVARMLARRLREHGDWMSRGELRKRMTSRDRPLFDEALDAAQAAGAVESRRVDRADDGHGGNGVQYRATEVGR